MNNASENRIQNRISLRNVVPSDEEFLYRLYGTTREDELSMTDWDDTQKESFLRMQFNAQNLHYSTYFPDAQHSVMVLDSFHVIGRIMVSRSPAEHRLIDISIVPEHRNKGIGTSLIQELIDEADEAGVPMRLHVVKFSGAKSLYKRLGFTKIEDATTHYFMERRAAQK